MWNCLLALNLGLDLGGTAVYNGIMKGLIMTSQPRSIQDRRRAAVEYGGTFGSRAQVGRSGTQASLDIERAKELLRAADEQLRCMGWKEPKPDPKKVW